MKTTKRKFSPAQLAAQKRFAAMAKAGTLKRKRRNTTIIKAKKISHLDVSKVHNGKKRNVSARRNAEHRDAQHPIHVRDYWQGRRGYKSQWQRAHEAGQRQLFGVKNPGFAEKFHDAVWMWATHKTENGYAWKVYSVQYQKPSVTVAEGIKPTRAQAAAAAKKSVMVYRRWAKAQKAKNPRRGTRAQMAVKKQYLAKQGHLKDSPARIEASRQLDINELRRTRAALAMKTAESKHGRDSKQYKKAHLAWQRLNTVIDKLVNKIVHNPGRRRTAPAKNPVFTVLAKVANEYGTTWLTVTIPSAVNKLEALRLAKAKVKGTPLEGRIKAWKVEKLSSNNTQLYASAKPKTRARVNGKRRVSAVASRRNGANTSLARRRRAEFVGRPSTQTKTLYAPNGSGASGTLAQLGKLHKITIKGGKTFNFKGVPTLAQHPKTDQLFVLGKNYTVNAPKKNPSDRMVDLGEVKTIEYEAVKTHLGDTKPVRYYHHFGEEGGERPHALVNEEGLIIFSGGDYYIRPEGIRD